MKLPSQSKKKRIILIAIVALALLLIAGIVVGITIISSLDLPGGVEIGGDPNAIKGIIISATPSKTVYAVGEEFSPEGLKIQVLANSNAGSYFIDNTNSELKFSGFDSETTGQKTITVTYREFSVSFFVTVNEKSAPSLTEKALTSIRLSDNFQTTYTVERWNKFGPRFKDVKLICTYSDGTEKEVEMLTDYVYGIDTSIESVGTTQFTIKYNEGGIEVTTTVTVTITE